MPPTAAPIVTHPVAMPSRALNQWLTTENAMVVGAAVHDKNYISQRYDRAGAVDVPAEIPATVRQPMNWAYVDEKASPTNEAA